MTLADLLHTTGRALQKNDYEFLVGDDGLAHLVIFIEVTGSRDSPVFTLFCPCGAIKGPRVESREIATGVTCMACNTR